MSIEDVILVATKRHKLGNLPMNALCLSGRGRLNVQAVGVASPVNPNQSSTQGRDDDYEWDAKHLEKTAGRLETLLGEKITQVFREPPVLKGVLRENPENVMVKPPARAGETREEKVWLEAEEIANGATELAVHPKAEEAAEKEAAKPEAEMKVVTKSRMKSKREAMVEAKRKAVAEAKRKAEAEEERKAEAEAKRKAEVDTEAQGETSTTIHRFPGL
ncbi:hypothetical protein B0F90DRAFT_1816526 [Multifurca ochricompacta]|uniref:Uncharacterized protein n=1 Tax=Multifurca ochricompacta TaxID=376703 RepID=A0AAD4M5W5_9AGAM|nr:hypothetical protein B0F90DRAFT_1816526 [Multifurca ochricompacta]